MLFMDTVRNFWLWFLRCFPNVSNEAGAGGKGEISPARYSGTCSVRGKYGYDICVTKDCVFAANDLLSAMNPTVDPCEDFYEYACGRWITENPIPADMIGYGTFAATAEKINHQLKALLESNENTKSKFVALTRTLYKSCMNTEQIKALKTKELVATLRHIGQWPVLEKNWSSSKFSITDLFGSLMANGFGNIFLFSIMVQTDAKNATVNTLHVDQASLGLGAREYYVNKDANSKVFAAYKKYLLKTLEFVLDGAGVPYVESQLKMDIDEITAFETELAKITVSGPDRRDNMRMYNKKMLADLYSLLPQMDWLKFFLHTTPESIHDIINNSTTVIVSEVQFMQKLSKLLDATDVRVLANYIFSRTLGAWSVVLDEDFDPIVLELLKIKDGQQKLQPRWLTCVSTTAGFLTEAVGALYIRKHFSSHSRHEAEVMLENILEAFVNIVKEIDWMDYSTKLFALQKVAAMVKVIGYDDMLMNVTALNELHQKLDLTPEDSYFKIRIKLVLWIKERLFLNLKKPFDRKKLTSSASSTNAFQANYNALMFPAGILTPPFFSASYPKAVNYGAIGLIIGHEITHAFDDNGALYDKDGSLTNWWSNVSYQNFKQKAQCFVKQYGNYELPNTGLKVNGQLTLGENIADNGGIKESFTAYKKYIKKRGCDEPRLPGLQNYTNEQIFFLSFARVSCSHSTKEFEKQLLFNDVHSPDRFRVNGVLANTPQFGEAFRCRPGTLLNPTKRCSVW